MKIAIYARKSKMTDQGESIDNQINSCKDYIIKWSTLNKDNIDFVIYKDEGFSGGNTARPEFQRLLSDAKNNSFDILICYRLDRVSRNIADFSNTYELLQEHGIEFVSVKEQFDTSTPIGRAMLNIAMVFAQLERETIAERVRDNMLALARTGRWLGGIAPTGFISKPIEYLDNNMHTKKMYQLSVEKNEMEKVKIIFDKFLEIKSLRGTESYLLIHNVLSKNDCKYTAITIKLLLTNPVYVAADQDIYEYLLELNCDICNAQAEFNGKHALMVYNKTKQSGKGPIANDCSNWIVTIGKHKPVLNGKDWIMVQELLKSNTANSFYTKEGMQYGLLTSLIKCSHCGSTMKIKKGKVNNDGELAYTYVCSTKEMSRRTHCNVKNIIGQEVDKDLVDYLLSLTKDDSVMMTTLAANQFKISADFTNNAVKIKELESTLEENQTAITNLMEQMARIPAANTSLTVHFIKQLTALDEKNNQITQQLERLKDDKHNHQLASLNVEMVRNALLGLKDIAHTDDIHLQRSLIRSIVEQITWDGENLDIKLFGQEHLDTHFCCDCECNPYS